MVWGDWFQPSAESLYDDWGWISLGPILLIQGLLLVSVIRSQTIRYQQMMLCLCGFFWCGIVYYVQFNPKGSRIMFCDVRISKCSYCLHHAISYLPELVFSVEHGSSMNRSIADTSVLYYAAHVIYPLTQKIPLTGRWMTHLGFLVSLLVSAFCVYLAWLSIAGNLGDICLVNSLLYVINWGLSCTMWRHLQKLISTRKKIEENKAKEE